MTVAIPCPDRASLDRLLEQGAGSDEIEHLAEHLETCPRCGEAVEALLAADRTAAALRGARVAPDESSVQLLRARLVHLRPDPGTPDATPLVGEAPSAAPSLEETQEESVSLAPPQQIDEIGRLGGYRILKELGRGGMGVVYKAEDGRLKRAVAVKVMRPGLAARPRTVERFLREAQAAAAVEHDHIVRIYQVDEDRGVPFFAMELLKGEPLDERLKRDEKPPLAEALRIGREIAEGLAAAHANGLIHRDIKPGNIWLEAPGGRVKILDFGLARAAAQDSGLTQEGAILGTPAYMAPEQARGQAVDGRCDLFSLGVVLYRLCTGRQPFQGNDTISTLMDVATRQPPPPIRINPELPQEASDMIMTLLEKDPARRPESAAEVARALQALERRVAQLEGGEQTAAQAAAPRGRLPLVLAAAAALLLLALLGGLIAVASGLIRIQTDQGDYVIDTDDPDVFFQVHNGAVTLEDRKEHKAYTLKVVRQDKEAKDVEMDVSSEGDLVFKKKTFTIKRGEKAAVTAWFERAEDADATPPPPPLPEGFMQKVAALPAEQQGQAVLDELKARNPNFDAKGSQAIVTDGVVTQLNVLTDEVTDITPVRALTGLQWLTLAGTQTSPTTAKGRLVDLSPLKGMRLKALHVGGTRVSDLSPLKGMPLQELYFGLTKVSDLSPLEGMPLLDLACSDTRVSDLSPLKNIKLQRLWCNGTRVSDLSPLRDMSLNLLDCERTRVSDLSPLKGMPLKFIVCDFKAERDAEILRSIPTLEEINYKPAKDFWPELDPKKSDKGP